MSNNWSHLLEDEDEDAIFARIKEESYRHFHEVELPRRNSKNDDESYTDCGESSKVNENICEQIDDTSQDILYNGPESGTKGFYLLAGETYIYPTNYPVRDYQINIVRSALFHNTLVCLPTGLGKTFIAAVVMYNYYRWFPKGKIVFMAPTRPLVAQQIRACHDIMAIPRDDSIEMTGTLNPIERAVYWKSRRVFFLTPQVLVNDLKSKVCPATLFKCVVVDEAHRATKEYAYCQVIRALEEAGAEFRILALSATPGNNVKNVVEVVKNLRISKLEMRGEESLDVAKYTHSKNVQQIVVQLSGEIRDVREQFLNIFEKYARSLRNARVITGNLINTSKFQFLKAGEKLKSHGLNNMSKEAAGYLLSDLTVCMSLAHALELLQIYGLRAFQHYLTTGNEEGDKSKAAFTRLKKDGELYELLSNIQKTLAGKIEKKVWSHPKLEEMEKIITEHFISSEENTKAIIFCQYRLVVNEVFDILSNSNPGIKPIMFVGQSTSRDKCGLPQKKQLEVMKGFRCGEYNVLIATSVAEEGLDIGAVDLLILMEAHRSPVRLVQRLGRTGRHRSGKCIVLLTDGKEVQKFQEAMESRKSYTTKMLSSSVIVANLFDSEPVMLPPGVKPKQQLLNIKVEKHVTPAKPQKQVDIRSAFGGKQSSNKPAQSPYLSIGKLMQVVEELGTTSINFNRINLTDKIYLWERVKDGPMDSEEFFNTPHSYLSEWNDWNSSLQPTYNIGHSSVTEILCDLLKKANSVQTNDDCLNSQFSVTQVLGKKKFINKKKKDKKTKENIKKEELNLKMDIRNCFVLAGEKTKLTQQKLWDKLTKSSQKDRPSNQISEKKIIKLDLTLDIEDDDFNINNLEDIKSPTCDEILIMESNNISDEVKKAPAKSKCIFSIHEDTMDMVVEKILPTSRVKLTENLNRVSSFNFCDLKNQISLEVIQNFNVKKTFENIKTPDHENISVKQKIASLALVDIKNIIGGKNKNISQTPVINKMYKEGMKRNTKIENDLKSRNNLKLIQPQKRKFSEVQKYCSTQNRLDFHSKNNEEELKSIVINTSNVKFPPSNIVIDYKVDKIESENKTRITSMELDYNLPAFKNDTSDIVDLDCLFTEENEINFTSSPEQASAKFDKTSLNETLQIDRDKKYSDDLFTEEDNDLFFENTPEDGPYNALSNKSTGCSVDQISNHKNKNNLFFGKNIKEETLKSKQLLLKKSDSLDDFFTEEVNKETNKTFLKASHNAELFTKTILYDEKVSNTSVFGHLLQEDKTSELKKTFPKTTEIRDKSNLNIYLLNDCDKTVSNDKDISDLDDLFADDVKEDINNTLFKNTKPFEKPKSNFNTLNKSQSTITKLNAENADENLCDIDDLFGEEINETFIKNQSNSKKINNQQYFDKPILRDTKQICNTSLSNINGKKLQVVIKPKKEEDFVGIDDLFNDEFDWSCVQNTSTNDSDSKVKNISKYEFDKTKENKFDSFQKSQINPNIKKSNLLQIKIPEDKINFDELEAATNTNKNGSYLELSPVLRSSQGNANVKITNFCKKNLFPEKTDFCKKNSKQTKSDYFNDTQNETIIVSKETIIMKEDEKNELWSVDQLFEDSCDMEESMYTISQLVRKSSEMSLITNENLILNEELINKEQQNKPVKKTESCSGSDNFDVIDSLVNAGKRSPSILRNISSLHLKSSQSKDGLGYKTNVKNYNNSHLNINNSLNSDISNVNCKNKQPVNDKKLPFGINSPKIFPLESHKMEPVLSGGWLNCRSVSTPLKTNVKPSTSKWFNNCDSDSNSDVFESPIFDRRKPTLIKDSKLKDRKKQKKKTIEDGCNFVVNEADVSGPQMSSDEENTSGLDDLDESFINDLTQMPNTSVEQTYLDMEAVYLQTAKSPKIRPGGFKIPEVRKSRLEMDVFSQSMVEDLEDQDCYENDSFCVDDTEIIYNDPSILEIAEQILENRKKNKRKRIRHVSSSSSSCEENSLNKTHSNIVIAQKKKKIRVIESDSETDFENNL